jgi:uncharacterized protein (UPF0332 family)
MSQRIEAARKELARANRSLMAAKALLENHLYEDCVSRAYYAVLHAAKAALSIEGIYPQSHRGVRRLFSLHLVRAGKIEKEFAKILTAEQEDREIGDYDIHTEIEPDRAAKRVEDAERFVQRIENYLRSTPPNTGRLTT